MNHDKELRQRSISKHFSWLEKEAQFQKLIRLQLAPLEGETLNTRWRVSLISFYQTTMILCNLFSSASLKRRSLLSIR